MTSKHKTFQWRRKLKLLKNTKKNKRPAKELNVLFKVGKTQIYDIKKKLKLQTSG